MSVRDWYDTIKQTEKALSLLKADRKGLENKTSCLRHAREVGKNRHTDQCEADTKVEKETSYSRHARMVGKNEHTECVKELIKYRCNVNIQDSAGNTALHLLSEEGHTECVRELIKYRCDVNVQNLDGETALHLSSQNGHTECVIELIESGCDVNIQNITGNTALHLSVHWGHTECVEVLLEVKCRVDVRNGEGRTALDEADRLKNVEIVQLLQKADKSIQKRESKREKIVKVAVKPMRKDDVKCRPEVVKEDKSQDKDLALTRAKPMPVKAHETRPVSRVLPVKVPEKTLQLTERDLVDKTMQKTFDFVASHLHLDVMRKLLSALLITKSSYEKARNEQHNKNMDSACDVVLLELSRTVMNETLLCEYLEILKQSGQLDLVREYQKNYRDLGGRNKDVTKIGTKNVSMSSISLPRK